MENEIVWKDDEEVDEKIESGGLEARQRRHSLRKEKLINGHDKADNNGEKLINGDKANGVSVEEEHVESVVGEVEEVVEEVGDAANVYSDEQQASMMRNTANTDGVIDKEKLINGHDKANNNGVEVEEEHIDSAINEVQGVVEEVGDVATIYYDEQQAGNAVSINVACLKDQMDENALLDDLANGTSFIKHEITNGHVNSWIGETRILQDWKTKNGLNSEYDSERYNGGTAKCGSELEKHENITTLKKDEVKEAEFDLERVLEEQETHDLYCPNCNSCITRRVILRKRKRTVRESKSDAPSKKIHEEQPGNAELVSSSSTPEQPIREDEEPDVFRCLSCFSFFIPAGDGFNIFRIFGKREETLTESLEPRPQKKTNWISAIFKSESNKKKESESVLAETIGASGTSTGEVSHLQSQETHVVVQEVIESSSTMVEQWTIQSITNRERILPDHVILEEKQTTSRDIDTVIESSSTMVEQGTIQSITNKERILPDDVMLEGKQTTSKDFDTAIASSSIMVEQVMSQFMTNRESILPDQVMPEGKQTTSRDFDTVISNQGQLNIQAQYKPTSPIELPSGVRIPLPEHANYGDAGKSVMNDDITDEIIQTIPSSAGDAAAPLLSTHIRIDIDLYDQVSQQGTDWDVLKSIVYGGLMESITSLGVVSSAAGANASTLTIIGLGLANLMGGLMIIIHDLFGLKTEHDEVTDRKDERVGRYWQLVGQRKHFRLHVFVAIVSYILMGLLPPVVYGFTWLKSDNREYKLIAVAASSLLCISLLAIGKAHVRRHKAYFQCLFYYLSLGVSVSGLSFVAGILINKLLEKLGLYDLNPHSPVPSNIMYREINGEVPTWAS